MYAWMNKEGKWLVVRENSTNTGHHVLADWTADINKASVMPRVHPKLNSIEVFPVPVNVVETRTVTVKVELMDAAGKVE